MSTLQTHERLMRIETRLDQTATKADMHELEATIIKWIVGTVSGLGVAGITVMTFVLNNPTPKPAPTAAAAPIIITVPQPAAAPALK